MTELQVKYWGLKETERSNRANEGLRRDELNETIRHNVAVEGETHRHNVQSELIGWAQVAETHRHNVAYEKETNRHNLATETISSTYNEASISLQTRAAEQRDVELGIRQQEADTRQFVAETQRWQANANYDIARRQIVLDTVRTATGTLVDISTVNRNTAQSIESYSRTVKNVDDVLSDDDSFVNGILYNNFGKTKIWKGSKK